MGRDRFEQREIDFVRPFVRRGRFIDADPGTGHGTSDRVGQVLDLIVALVTPDIDREKLSALFGWPLYRPQDRPGHVLDVDQRTPGRAVTQNVDTAGGHSAGDEV